MLARRSWFRGIWLFQRGVLFLPRIMDTMPDSVNPPWWNIVDTLWLVKHDLESSFWFGRNNP
jgi:hypothetical protein